MITYKRISGDENILVAAANIQWHFAQMDWWIKEDVCPSETSLVPVRPR